MPSGYCFLFFLAYSNAVSVLPIPAPALMIYNAISVIHSVCCQHSRHELIYLDDWTASISCSHGFVIALDDGQLIVSSNNSAHRTDLAWKWRSPFQERQVCSAHHFSNCTHVYTYDQQCLFQRIFSMASSLVRMSWTVCHLQSTRQSVRK